VSAWQLDFVARDGIAGFVRLELREAESTAWYWTYLVNVPGHEGIVVVRDHDVPLPRQGLEIRAEGLWAELWCETKHEHWTFGLEAFGVRLDAPEDAQRAGGEIGERVAVGLDLEWETPDVVHGDVLVGRDRFPIDGYGTFYDDAPVAAVDGETVARVIVRDVGERRLVQTTKGLRWTPLAWLA
jgi:hypothetical protein